MKTLEDLVRIYGAKQSGNSYKACCPVHEDRQASLALGLGRNGAPVLKCFAGCDTHKILAAKGLTFRDLYPSERGRQTRSDSVVATYVYRDAEGIERYRKCRTATKKFWFDHLDSIGRRAKGRGETPPLLYRASEARNRSLVFIVEGEKDTDRLWSIGIAATTNDNGASQDFAKPKWTETHTAQLKALGIASAVLIPDNDDAGRAHMKAVAASLHGAGIAVQIAELPGLPVKGDVSDWLDAGHAVNELQVLAHAAPCFAPNGDRVPRADDAALTRIESVNERFAVLSVGNRMVVAEFDHDELLELWPFDEFKRRLIKEAAVGRQSFADFWLKHPNGRQYDRLVYVMPGSDPQRVRLRPGDYNGWRGFTVEPAAGDWSRNREHLQQIICAGDERNFAWVLNWLAALVQRPGQHAWSAIVLRGEQGTGKGYFADFMIGKCFHPQQYLHLVGANQLTAEFNEHFSGKVFIFGDETVWGGEKHAAERLKGLVTEDTVLIHRKFLKAVEEPSALHIVMASNSEWPVAIPKDERRFMVLDVADSRRQDQDYFAALRAEFNNGGRGGMLHDLLHHAIDDAALRQPLETDAKRDVRERTLSPEETWLQDWLANPDGNWAARIPKSVLYADYKHSLPRHIAPRSIVAFGKVFKRAGIAWKECKQPLPGGGGYQNAYEFPSLQQCRAAFDATLNVETAWPEEDESGVRRDVEEP